MGVEEVVAWLTANLDSINGLFKLIGILGGVIAAFRKWVLKPAMETIDKNRQAVVDLQNDYTVKRNEVFAAVEALKEEVIKNDHKSEERHEKLRAKFEDMRKEMGTMQDDVADVLGNELENGHRKFMTQGWCSPGEKQHYVDMHKRYSERGHNHLAQHYEEDLLQLPDDPPMMGGLD